MVTETTENGNGSSAVAKTGLGLSIGALGLLLLQNGALGGVLGGRPQAGDPPWARDMGYERQLTERDAKIGKLEAQIYTDDKVDALRRELSAATAAQAVINAQQGGVIGLLQSQVATLNAMTSPYIKQPVMAASEAALTAFKANATSTSNG